MRFTRPTLFLLFFLSGGCGLIYQVVWVRMLGFVLGSTVLAVSTVLTAFMAGLALGSFSFGRVVDRRTDALRIYAYLEIGIGLFGLAMPALLPLRPTGRLRSCTRGIHWPRRYRT